MTIQKNSDDNLDTNESDAARDKREQRAMWIFSGAIVLIILGGMGANMLWGHHDQTGTPTDLSSQSRMAPAK
jgi:hypothetical protein